MRLPWTATKTQIGLARAMATVMDSDAYRSLPDNCQTLLARLWGCHARVVYQRDDGMVFGYCWPSNDRLAEKIGKDARTVKRRLAALKDAGLIDTYRADRKRGIVLIVPESEGTALCPITKGQQVSHHEKVKGQNRQGEGTESHGSRDKNDHVKGHFCTPYKEEQIEQIEQTEQARARENVGEFSRLICEVYPKHFGHSNTARQFIEAVDRIADQHESREHAARWIVDQARAHWSHIVSVCDEDPMTCVRVKVLHNWLDDSAYEQTNLAMRYAHLRPQGALNRPYGASQAPDESRVNEIRERMRINRRASQSKSREAM